MPVHVYTCNASFVAKFVTKTGGPIGPLSKADYLSTMDTFKIHQAFPDVSPNAFGFSIDPLDSSRVWFFCARYQDQHRALWSWIRSAGNF